VAPVNATLYLDLLEDCLLGVNVHPGKDLVPLGKAKGVIRPLVQRQLGRRGWIISRRVPRNLEAIEDWGDIRVETAVSMIGRARMRNIRGCVESVLVDRIPGDLIETGVWRGGACIYMRGILAAYDEDREVWAADSFAGLPEAHHPVDARWVETPGRMAVSLDEVRENFARYRLLDERVHLVKGWFRDTLPALRDRTWALIRLDGDMYESTMDGLTNLYDGLSPGGYLIVDDYGGIPNCERAVEDFRTEHNISDPIETIDDTGVFWRKS
jgi:O-methyltransferase